MGWSLRQYLIVFNMVPGIGGRRLIAIEKHFGSLQQAWKAGRAELMKVPGIGTELADRLCTLRGSLSPQAEEAWAKQQGARIVTIYDKEYPNYLRRLAVPPPVLYVAGKLPEEEGIAVVGTRKPSRVGIAQARQFSAYLAARGIPVISGLARGIDYHAHQQVVESKGTAVAVLGSNLEKLYPGEHRLLARKIAEQGAVITEFSSKCPTVPGNFPRRNRIIAGCARGVLVVQAGAKSGTLHTADWALELGIDVWAIPGEVSDPLRQGNHSLIKQGAGLVTEPADLLIVPNVKGEQQDDMGGSTRLRELYAAGQSANQIAAALDMPIQEVLAEISLLQLEEGS